jgi:hypothetical protein
LATSMTAAGSDGRQAKNAAINQKRFIFVRF